MKRGSKRQRKADKAPIFGPETSESADDIVEPDALYQHLRNRGVSVSLRYFQSSCECFSKWQNKELKKFSGTLEKIRGYNANLLKQKKSLCDSHKGDPDEGRFSRPEEISPDMTLYEIKVDPSNKLRMHGFFVDDVFFLIWLDREHKCFKV
ncbi:hypothetical protein [Fodinicurvata sp. EGI_FJ10296]|uniref:hypothetical protein n=1 Tax=Fodinicurvata sp. EGI_FJ10296 TaxID=3231908 RepID=UPI0034533EBC